MTSWWLPHLIKGPTPDFNNGPGNYSNNGCMFALQCLFESNLNNSPSPSHSNLASDRVYICSGLLLMVSWWVPYLSKGCRPDINNGQGGNLNSGPISSSVYLSLTSIMAQEVTGIVVPFWPPSVYLSLTRLMAPSQATPILCQMKYTSVQVSHL